MVLPVESCWPDLASDIVNHDVILVAPPGAGKSTYLPLKLLQLPVFAHCKIIMLQPRQVAVRSIAQYLAQQLGEPVGQTIGYRMRGESKVSNATRLEIVTEGLLTRMIQSDAELSGVGLIIFDEFHERNIHADFSLALSLEIQQGLRADLRLLIMSATLNADELLQFMPEAKMLQSEGRSYPVSTYYRPAPQKTNLVPHACTIVCEALSSHAGNILVFMTGAKDIQGLAASLQSKIESNVEIYPLYGDLSKQSQFDALADTKQGMRKIVIATNIAETSLTIDGISVVVDSGKEKSASFNFQRQMQVLKTINISKASSVQRAGRAGRLQAGHCYRLWSEETQQRLIEHRQAQIAVTDVTDLILEAIIWGSRIQDLPLLTKPSVAQIDYGYNLLVSLGAIDNNGVATRKGKAVAKLGCAPELANLLVSYASNSCSSVSLACVLVAIIEGKPIVEMRNTVFVSQHIEFLLSQPKHPLWRDARRWAQKLSIEFDSNSVKALIEKLPEMLAFAFPFQVARRRTSDGYQLSSGTGANLPYLLQEFGDSWLSIAKMTIVDGVNAIIRLAEPIDENAVLNLLSDRVTSETLSFWDEGKQKIVTRKRQYLGKILLLERSLKSISGENDGNLIIDAILKKGLNNLSWSKNVQQLINRVNLAHTTNSHLWPDFSNEWLTENIHTWLKPYLMGVATWQQLINLDWYNVFKSMLDWPAQKQLDLDFPTHLSFELKTSSEQPHRLTYSTEGGVSLEIKIQQIYGQQNTPSIAKNQIPVTLNLLSPANRSLHITQNLADFWTGSYKEVQKEMKGRYPKHFWPDEPATAKPTTRIKKFM